jgi:hypothetical protein
MHDSMVDCSVDIEGIIDGSVDVFLGMIQLTCLLGGIC